jgi:CBS domain-containing protein
MAGAAMPLAHGKDVPPPEPLPLVRRSFPRNCVWQARRIAMKVSDIMTREVFLASPSQKLREAAAEMEKNDIGVLPVRDNDRLVGMITDRDIAIRGISRGLGPDAPVSDVMSKDVRYCFEDQDIDELAQNMADEQIRRLPVLNHDKRLVGIISLGDLAVSQESEAGEMALSGISQAGGCHCQSASA